MSHDFEKIYNSSPKYDIDFSDVKGQENVKRALEIAASGGHNILMTGNPGSGKTMMAKRLQTILPNLSLEEALEITKLHSISGQLQNDGLVTKRPFRMPHHTVPISTIIGGGAIPRPGEISLAHYGILFFDELTEFNKNILEALRGPLEDKEVTISRLNGNLTYPCNFMFIASMNPCNCGNYGSDDKECTCSPNIINKYFNKISKPLLDRIDIQLNVKTPKYEKLSNNIKSESSKEIKERVDKARKIQVERYRKCGIYSNSELTAKLIDKFCKIDDKSKMILENAFKKLNLSARSYNSILKVARTIADLDGKENIEYNHILEAIQYRSFDKRYGNYNK